MIGRDSCSLACVHHIQIMSAWPAGRVAHCTDWVTLQQSLLTLQVHFTIYLLTLYSLVSSPFMFYPSILENIVVFQTQPVAALQTLLLLSNLPKCCRLATVFTNSAPLGRVCHRVALFVCLCVCFRHQVQFFSRPLIGPQIT